MAIKSLKSALSLCSGSWVDDPVRQAVIDFAIADGKLSKADAGDVDYVVYVDESEYNTANSILAATEPD